MLAEMSIILLLCDYFYLYIQYRIVSHKEISIKLILEIYKPLYVIRNSAPIKIVGVTAVFEAPPGVGIQKLRGVRSDRIAVVLVEAGQYGFGCRFVRVSGVCPRCYSA